VLSMRGRTIVSTGVVLAAGGVVDVEPLVAAVDGDVDGSDVDGSGVVLG
jgi:hypothetical protein